VLTLSFERTYKVLRLSFVDLLTPEDIDAIDPAVLGFLAGPDRGPGRVRLFYDMSQITALAAPSSRFADRARLPPVGGLDRIILAPDHAGPDFGRSYRDEGMRSGSAQPIIVRSRSEAYRLLGMTRPRFQPIE
jgi:hypothetical protein